VAYEIKELVAAKAAGAPADDNGPKFEYKVCPTNSLCTCCVVHASGKGGCAVLD
jgi:hypothetical protein